MKSSFPKRLTEAEFAQRNAAYSHRKTLLQMTHARKNLTLNQIRYFVRAADLGSMTDTAEELYIAQSAVSAAISQLEHHLGHKLFVRLRSRGVVLTDRGRTFYPYARQILSSVDEAFNSMHPGSLTGTLSVGFYSTLAPFWLPQIFEDITTVHPDLDVVTREVNGDEIELLLQHREIELAFAYNFDYGKDAEFIPLETAPVYAAVSENNHLAAETSVTLAQLVDEPLILLNLGKSANYFLSIFHDAQLRPRVQHEFESPEVVRAMVARGHGYTILNQGPPHNLAPDGRRIVRLPISDVHTPLQIGIVHRAGDPLSRKGRVFMEACREALAQTKTVPGK